MTTSVPKERSWIRYLWLLYLVFALYPLFLDPEVTAWDWAVTLVGIGLFVPVYLRAYDRLGTPLFPYLGAMALLGLVFSQFNPSLSTIFIFVAAAAGQLGSTRLAWQVVLGMAGLVLLSAGMVGARQGWHPELIPFGFALFFTLLIGALNIFSAERDRYNQRLFEAHAENQHLAAIAERERIARDLHDLLGHTFSLVTLKADLAARLAERDPARAALEMHEIERISREATQQVREAVQGYKSRGLQGELVGAKLALEAANIRLEYYADPLNLSPTQESVLSLALREAVTNLIRHSAASRCAIRLLMEEKGVKLEVEDDGKGGAVSAGSGLTGMRQRVEALGGSLETSGEQSFRLRVFLPTSSPGPLPALPVLKSQSN